MKKQILAIAVASVFAVNGVCADQSKAAQEQFDKAKAFSEMVNKTYAELKELQYSDPKAYEAKLEELKKKQAEFDMAGHVRTAIEVMRAEPESDVGFAAMELFAREFNAIRARGEAKEGELNEEALIATFDEMTSLALKHQIGNEKLWDVLVLPAMMLNYGKGYTAVKELWQTVLGGSPHREVRGKAAYALAELAIGTSQSTRAEEEVKRQAGMDVSTYSELVMKEYGDIESYRGGTLKSMLEGKLFAMNGLQPGKELPNVKAKNLKGEMDQLTNYRGKVVLVDFWATWCGPCKAALPKIAELKEELAGKPFEVISISVDDEVDMVVDYQENEQPMPWVNWHIGPDSPILTEWGVRGYPTYYVVDAEGIIRDNTYFDDKMKAKIIEIVDSTN